MSRPMSGPNSGEVDTAKAQQAVLLTPCASAIGMAPTGK